MPNFSSISKIDVAREKTWKNKIFLTFDIDWAHEEIIYDCCNLIAEFNVEATWFITHKSPNLQHLSKKHEIGIHPNFNNLLAGDSKKTCKEILSQLINIAPNSKSVRSHSLLNSERLLDLFYENGITHISNLYLPYKSKIVPKPFNLWNNLTVVPHVYQDNATIRVNDKIPKNLCQQKKINVFLFHPIHIFLNTENLDRYEKTRPIHQKPSELIKYRFEGYGVRQILLNILSLAKNK